MTDISSPHIEALYVEYTDVIKRFTKEKIYKRYHRLLLSAQEFIKGMGYNDHVVCNETILMRVVLGYFSDVMRLKEFHDIERTNNIKIQAYEASWLLKRKPLQIKDSNDQKFIFCNEQFVFSEITCWLRNSDGDDGSLVLAHENLEFFSNMLFYHLKYRNCDPPILELMLTSFIAGRTYQHLLPINKKLDEKHENMQNIGKFRQICRIIFNKNTAGN